MENKETITTLKGVEEKESKAGRKYKSFQTDSGAMTCFEEDIVAELQKHIGKKVRIEISENKGFKNIKKFLGEVSEEKISQEAKPSEDSFEAARKLKDQSIYTSYAKDVFMKLMDDKNQSNELHENIMKRAITLVKQARDSFFC